MQVVVLLKKTAAQDITSPPPNCHGVAMLSVHNHSLVLFHTFLMNYFFVSLSRELFLL